MKYKNGKTKFYITSFLIVILACLLVFSYYTVDYLVLFLYQAAGKEKR